jgi:hypothetical protein
VPDARVLNETGDGFLVRFDDPSDAVNTALLLQWRLKDEVCEGAPMRIRIGLHLGMVTEMDERIRGEKRAVGMPINLTARIMDLADGGQILMTRAVYEDARNFVRGHPDTGAREAPPELQWKSHGLYEFKGNPEAIEIFEAGAVGLAPFTAPESSGKAKRAGHGGAPAVANANVVTPGPAAVEIIPPEALRNSDVLLNYAAIDDVPVQEGRSGWVSELHRNLQVRVEQFSGEKVKIARAPRAETEPVAENEMLEYLPAIKAMVSVVSPPFVHSKVCCREVENFWRIAERTGGRWVEDRSRLLKVLKTSVAPEEMPPVLADIFSPLMGFEFFERSAEGGRIREFDESFGPALKQRFFERVYGLAYDVSRILKNLRLVAAHPGAPAAKATGGTRHRIFLATTTSDVQDERDRIRRELLERGHQVLPEGPLPMLANEVATAVQECLSNCSIAVHLLGQHYGMTPEDSAESVPALQLRLSAQHAQQHNLQRLIWMPGTGACVDRRQSQFLSRVQEDSSLQHRAEIIEGNLNLLKQDLIRCLAPPEEKPKSAAAAKAGHATPKLYLLCDAGDETNVEPLEDYLFNQGLEVCLPAFDGDDAAAAALHHENLLTCDAVLVYYGAAPRAWVEIKLRELLKAAGYGRETPLSVQGVYIAPPVDHRKERFRSHQAAVIHQSETFAPGPELEAFIRQIKESGAGR